MNCPRDKHGKTALEGVPRLPPSVLPDISPSRGEIGQKQGLGRPKALRLPNSTSCRLPALAQIREEPLSKPPSISPLEGGKARSGGAGAIDPVNRSQCRTPAGQRGAPHGTIPATQEGCRGKQASTKSKPAFREGLARLISPARANPSHGPAGRPGMHAPHRAKAAFRGNVPHPPPARSHEAAPALPAPQARENAGHRHR